MNNKGRIAITEIMILLIGIVAMIYSIGLVSGQGEERTEEAIKKIIAAIPIATKLFSDSTTQNPAPGFDADRAFFRHEGPIPREEPYTFDPIDITDITGEDPPKIEPPIPGRSSALSKFLGAENYPGWNALLSGLQWAAIAYGAVQFIGPMIGLDRHQTDSLSWAAAAGFGAGKAAQTLGYSPGAQLGIGLGLALIVYAATYKEVKYKIVRFSCNAWDAETGSSHCEDCNKQELPCSEYQCRSLGQGCELVNKGTESEMCVGISREPNPPIIEPWEIPLTDGYEYTPDNTINPPDRGVRIINTQTDAQDECVQAFTPLKFGVKLDEPARCKIDSLRRDNYEDMLLEISNGLKLYNHTIQFELPGVSNTEQEGIELENDGNFELYVRCEDANGNSNLATFVFKYCVTKGPDYQAPEVVDTNVIDNFPIAFGQESFDFELYVNEPAKCRWSHEDVDYEDMPEQMNCPADRSDEGVVINVRTVYPCTTTLTGLKDKQDNIFYFRCEDQPLLAGTDREGDRNTNSESYVHTIIGTQPLVIDDAGPNGTIRDSTIAVKTTLTAKTSAGFNEGEAVCSYKEVGDADFIDDFSNTNSYQHSTDLFLAEGDYEYIIRCIDLGGNKDIWQVNFTTESDSEPPVVVRAYKEENFLKIVTDEVAECVYDTQDCSYLFEDGLPMTDSEENHFITWDTKEKFYVKCRDEYGNEPSPDECSVIIKTLE